MFLDDTACNLASLNLMKFVGEDGEFDVEDFRAACRTMITAQEILVDNSSYPTPAIDRNSHDYRPLGLGYANLGVLLMDRGLPYDSDEGRAYAAAVTALMHGEAYAQSARRRLGHGAVRRLREERGADAAGDRQAPQARAHDRLEPGPEGAACRPRSTCGTRPTRSAPSTATGTAR